MKKGRAGRIHHHQAEQNREDADRSLQPLVKPADRAGGKAEGDGDDHPERRHANDRAKTECGDVNDLL